MAEDGAVDVGGGVRYVNPMEEGEHVPQDEAVAAAGQQLQHKLQRTSSRDKMRLSRASTGDWSNYSHDGDADEDSGDAKLEGAIAAFHRLDPGGSGTLGEPAHMAELLKTVGWPPDDETVNAVLGSIWEESDKTRPIEEVTLQDFVTWWLSSGCEGYEKPDNCLTRLSSASSRVIFRTHRLLGSGQLENIQEKRATRSSATRAAGVAPESIFLLDRGDNVDSRETSRTLKQIHSKFANQFCYLVDVLLLREDNSHWQNLWERAAEKRFAELCSTLELSEEFLNAAEKVIVQHFGMAQSKLRSFVRSQYDISSGEGRRSSSRSPSISEVTTSAKSFAQNQAKVFHAAHTSLEDEERVTIDQCVAAVRASMEQECSSRQLKIKTLLERRSTIPPETPRTIRISGLRGDAAVANGLYSADGLRQFWGRALYVQESKHDSQTTHYLFYDQSPGTSSSAKTCVDMTWTVGPTLNRDRCTAYVDCPNTSHYPHLTLDSMADSQWMVFNIVSKEWEGDCLSAPLFTTLPPRLCLVSDLHLRYIIICSRSRAPLPRICS